MILLMARLNLHIPVGILGENLIFFLLSNFLDKLNNVFMLNIRHLRLWWDEESL